MFEIGSDVPAIHGIPEMHGIIGSRRDDLAAIGRPSQRVNGAMMPLVGKLLLPHPRIKNIDFVFATSAGQARTIGRPCYREDGFIRLSIPEARVTDVGKDLLTR